MRLPLCCAIATLTLSYGSVKAQDISDPVMRDVTNAVTKLCGAPDRQGEGWSVEVEGGAGVVFKIVDVEGSAKFTREEWDGIKDDIKDRPNLRDCVRDLVPKFLDRFDERKSGSTAVPSQGWESRSEALKDTDDLCYPARGNECFKLAKIGPELGLSVVEYFACTYKSDPQHYDCRFRVEENIGRSTAFSLPNSEEFQISITMTMSDFEFDKVLAGLYFGKADGKSYEFIIYSKGVWALLRDLHSTRWQDGEVKSIGKEVILGFEPIAGFEKSKPQRIELHVEDRYLWAKINGEPVITRRPVPDDFNGGGFGLIVGATEETTPVRVTFEDLEYFGEPKIRTLASRRPL